MNELLVVLAILAVVLVVFLVIPEFWTWYWKINETLGVLRGIRQDLATTNPRLAELCTINAEVKAALQSPDGRHVQRRAEAIKDSIHRREVQINLRDGTE